MPLYNVLPRARSSSLSSVRSLHVLPLSFFESPPPPPRVLPVQRVPVEPKPNQVESSQPPFSLALTNAQPTTNLNPAIAVQTTYYPLPLIHPQLQPQQPPALPKLRSKPSALNFHLDVGAYGIPKRAPRISHCRARLDHQLSVQVGEDAYFVRDNALGVADGVGGWAKSRPDLLRSNDPTPSAMFARRLMHYCSAEIDAFSSTYWDDTFEDDAWNPHDLESSLADLSDGIDILQILERAYETTVKTHLQDSDIPSGSSTALVAVLDHLPQDNLPSPSTPPQSTSSLPYTPALAFHPPTRNYAAGPYLDSSFGPVHDTDSDPSISGITTGSHSKTADSPSSAQLSQLLSSSRSRATPFLRKASHRTPKGSSSRRITARTSRVKRSSLFVNGSSSRSFSTMNCDKLSSSSWSPGLTPINNSPTPTMSSPQINIEFLNTKKDVPYDKPASTPLPSPSLATSSVDDVTIPLDPYADYDAVLRIAHVGDCMGMLVRGERIAWRTEEMWWAFNTPVQLAPPSAPTTSTQSSNTSTPSLFSSSPFASFLNTPDSTPTPPSSQPSTRPLLTPQITAHTCTVPVRANDILILASDGLSDNLWDEDVLDEVIRFRQGWEQSDKKEGSPQTPAASSPSTHASTGTQRIASSPTVSSSPSSSCSSSPPPLFSTSTSPTPSQLLKQRTLASMLSEALCSRARRVAEKGSSRDVKSSVLSRVPEEDGKETSKASDSEVPFARRAREVGRVFRGGKLDDISVIVAVISPMLDVECSQHV